MSSDRQTRLQTYIDWVTRKSGGLESLADTSPDLESTDERTAAMAATAGAALQKLQTRGGVSLSPDEMVAVEAIILPRERPAIDILGGDFQVTHPLWRKLNTDAAINAHLRRAIPSVGRIELPGQPQYPYGGTGFLVGPGLLMTNRHVAEIFAVGIGTARLDFRPGCSAAFDTGRERGQPVGRALKVRRVVMIHPYWDMALLQVDGLPAGHAHLDLSQMDVAGLDGREIAVIGYPAFDPRRNDVDVQNTLFDGAYGVKRLQPGMLGARQDTESFRKLVSAATHDCSTLGGNSGSCVVDLTTGEVVALHFGGRYLATNYAVPAFELARDGRVVDAGVSVAGEASASGAVPWRSFWDRAEAAVATAPSPPPGPPPGGSGSMGGTQGGGGMANGASTGAGGGISITLPLTITVHLGEPMGPRAEAAAPVTAVETEAMVMPWHDSSYAGRPGYLADFLDIQPVPAPEPADPAVLAPLLAGGTRLDYQNFSIWMHAQRRVALITASNVTAEAHLKQPEPGRGYSRRELTGLGENDREKWFPDPRLAAEFQLNDAFFTKDDGAFDKGHVVRRDDAAWGVTYDDLRRANGDTFHVTNCAPQVGQFNQSARGQDNWGDLENLILGEAASERLCLFAGPILDPADETFVGTAGGGQVLRVKIPGAFWKVVVARVREGLAVYGFILSQDLSAVPLEFTVSDSFQRLMVPLTEIERRAGIVFAAHLHAADQFGADRGLEVAFRAGIAMQADMVPDRTEAPTPNSGDDIDADDEDHHHDHQEGVDALEAPIDWRIAKSLLKLRTQVNTMAPRRSTLSDGAIGDAAHATRASDHNPWVMDGTKGVVTAIDVTHDPAGGCDATKLAEAIRTSKDSRVKYIIWNKQIASSAPKGGQPAWAWRAYSGSNTHTKHIHISVKSDKAAYDSEKAWSL